VPDLSPKGAARLRDDLLATFLAQMLVDRHVHGDLHQGNLAVLPDGKTVVLYDFGQTVKLSTRHLLAPARFAVGVLRKSPRSMARAVVDMSHERSSMSPAQRDAVATKVEAMLAPLLAEADEAADPAERILGAIVASAASSGLSLAPEYLQTVKTALAMSGNLAAFSSAGVPIDAKTFTRGAGSLARNQAVRMTPLGQAGHTFKRRRVARMMEEAKER
jgi:predicted unusual protein kinase regulating ubiquinone biosynthesis (AarF/ABC1/UbiB family)